MAATASDQVRMLVRTVINRLEKSPVEFVEALIDLLAAPERKRDERLIQDLLIQVWLLLECPESFVLSLNGIDDSDSHSQPTRLTPYDRLIQTMCNMIEAEIVRHWVPSKKGNDSFLTTKTAHLFWGGLALHIKLALPLEPCSSPTLFSHSVVTLSNGQSFPCEPPLSESQIHELITQLGHDFVLEYAVSYIRQEKLRNIITGLYLKDKKKNETTSKNGAAPFELLVQERSLNRYVDKFAKYLAAHLRDGCVQIVESPSDRVRAFLSSSSGFDSLIPQVIADASSALFIEPQWIDRLGGKRSVAVEEPWREVSPSSSPTDESVSPATNTRQRVSEMASGNPSMRVPQEPIVQVTSSHEILERFKNIQENTIRDSIYSTFIAPNLEYRDPVGAIHPLDLNELMSYTNQRLLITAPSGGGKTRLQQELHLLAREPNVHHLWFDLERFAASGSRSIYQFVANQILRRLAEDRDMAFNLDETLFRLDLNGKIYWHLEGWDEISKAGLSSVALSTAPLSQFTLSTSNPWSTLQVFKTNGMTLSGVVEIQPFTPAQVVEFIKTALAERSATKTGIERRALQLPGLAQIPNGLEYLCSHSEHETVVDILLGYINSNLQRIGEPLSSPDKLIFDGLKEITWQSRALDSAYFIAKVIWSRANGNALDFSHIAVDEILPYMGASNRSENLHLANERIEQALRGKFLVFDDSQSFRFIIPEIGFLLAAFVVLSQHHSRRWLDTALKEFQKDPHNSRHQMTLSLGAWHQEKLLLRHLSAATPLRGTTVPARRENLSQTSTPIVTQSQD